MKILKNKLVLGLASIIVLILTIFSYSKIREYNILKDVFVFKNENVVSIWRVKKGEDIHDYNYKMENDNDKGKFLLYFKLTILSLYSNSKA